MWFVVNPYGDVGTSLDTTAAQGENLRDYSLWVQSTDTTDRPTALVETSGLDSRSDSLSSPSLPPALAVGPERCHA